MVPLSSVSAVESAVLAAISSIVPWHEMQVSGSTVTTVALVAALSPNFTSACSVESAASSVWHWTQVTPSASWAEACGQDASVADAASTVWHIEQSESIVQFTGWPSMAEEPPFPSFCSDAAGAEGSAFGAQPASVHIAAVSARTTPRTASTTRRRSAVCACTVMRFSYQSYCSSEGGFPPDAPAEGAAGAGVESHPAPLGSAAPNRSAKGGCYLASQGSRPAA
ncbi:hypothetical protein HMPREF1023_01947 [Eggerthella sp. 1_3_56FAA]|nr:hypothetical protein HMPREF1023_01947 [Eggerthella sp. 1_3_56FAA]